MTAAPDGVPVNPNVAATSVVVPGMRSAIRELASKGLTYGLGSSVSSLAGFLLIPFYLHKLSAAEYGRYALAETVANLLTVVLGLGLNVSLLAVYPAKATDERARFLGELLRFVLLSTGIACTLLILAYVTARSGGLVTARASTAGLVIAVTATEVIGLLFATWYRAEARAWAYVAASSLQLVIALAATVVLIAHFGMRENGILLGRLLGGVAAVGIGAATVKIEWGLGFRWEVIRPVLRIGLPLVPATLSSLWVMTSPRIFVEWFGTTADVGVFTMSAKIAGVLSLLFVQPFAMAWMALLFRVAQMRDARRVYGRIVTYYVLIAGLLAGLLGLGALPVVPLLAQESFPLSPAVVIIMALATAASGLMYPLNIGPYVTGQTTRQTKVFLVSGALASLLGITFTAWLGVTGGALSLLLVFLLQAIGLAHLSQRLYPIELERLRLIKAVSAHAAGFIVAWAVSRIVGGVIGQWLLVPAFLVGSAVMLLGLRFPLVGETAVLHAVLRRPLGRR